MRNVVLYELTSLDGIAEEPGDWLFEVDEEIFANLDRVIGTQDAVLLGRGTYDYWVDYWPTSAVEPFASFINSTTKYVVTSRPLDQPWTNSVVVNTSLIEYVAALKQQRGGDIGVHGSIRLAQCLLRAGLVDELRLVVAPTLAGRGRRLFEDAGDLRRLELVEVSRTSAGNMMAYRVGHSPAAST